MRFGKKFIILLTVFFVLLVMLGAEKEQEPDVLLSVDVVYEDHTENISAWQWHRDEYVMYLPGNVDMAKMQVRFLGGSGWMLDSTPLSDRISCEGFPLNTPLTLMRDGEYAGTVTFHRSSAVGAMFLQTASGNMEYVHAQKGNEEGGELRLYLPSGDLNYIGPFLRINGRGNSTWNEEKKSYSMELPVEVNFMDMGSAKKWILLSNVYDATNLHNKVIYEFARDLGLAYSPDCEWVDLYLNGDYAGLYLLSERNEVHPQRVDISRENSFLVSRDAQWRFEEQGNPYITTQSTAALRIYHAGMDAEDMLRVWQSAENAILREDGIDPVTGKSWQELIDVDSWVRKYLVDEVFGNKDGSTLSQFYYYDASGGNERIYAGPVWDYDLTMDLDVEHPQESVQMFFANIAHIQGAEWPHALYRKQEYFEKICTLYEKDVIPLLDVYMETVLPRYVEEISDASEMNALRWGISDTLCDPQRILDFLKMRRAFLDDIWLNQTDYCLINAVDKSYVRVCYAVKPGSSFPQRLLSEMEDENNTYLWYDAQSGEVLSTDEPILTDMNIYIQMVSGPNEEGDNDSQKE